MVYLSSWEEFMHAAQSMYVAEPNRTRYQLKYRHKDGNVVLKVTDDRVCVKFKTDQSADVKKIDKLHALFLRMSTSTKLDPESLSAPLAMETEEKVAETTVHADKKQKRKT